MTALDRLRIPELPGLSLPIMREAFSRAVWQWYDEHADEVVFEKKVWLITIKIRYRDAENWGKAITRIAGARPFPK